MEVKKSYGVISGHTLIQWRIISMQNRRMTVSLGRIASLECFKEVE